MPFLKILTFWSKSKFYLVKAFSFSSFFFFFSNLFFCRWFGPGQVSRSVQVKTGVVEDDIIHDVMRRGHVNAYSACGVCTSASAHEGA